MLEFNRRRVIHGTQRKEQHMKKHRKTVLAAIMLILVVASAVFAARVHTVSLDAENVAKITAKSTVTQAPPDEIVLTDSQCRELAEKLGSITLYKSFFKYSGWKGWSFMFTVEYSDGREERITLKGAPGVQVQNGDKTEYYYILRGYSEDEFKALWNR